MGAKKTEETEGKAPEAKEPRYTPEELSQSQTFAESRDVVFAALDPKEKYTRDEAQSIIARFLIKKVK